MDPSGSHRTRGPNKSYRKIIENFLLFEFETFKVWSFRKIKNFIIRMTRRGPKNSICAWRSEIIWWKFWLKKWIFREWIWLLGWCSLIFLPFSATQPWVSQKPINEANFLLGRYLGLTTQDHRRKIKIDSQDQRLILHQQSGNLKYFVFTPKFLPEWEESKHLK